MSEGYSRAYLLTKVLTANNREVVLYLYEGALGYIARAVEARKQGDITDCNEAIDRVVSILIELSCSLDYNRSGSLALRLDSIYNYLIDILTEAARTRNIEAFETCRSVLNVLSDAWRQAIAMDKSGAATVPQAQMRVSA